MSSTQSEPLSDHQQTLTKAPHRPVKAHQCYLAYSLSLIIGWLCWYLLLDLYPDNTPFMNGLIVTTVATFVVYVFSIINNNSSIYDPYWVIAPPFLALGIKATSEAGLTTWHLRDILVMLCFAAWAVRYHSFYPWEGWRSGLTIEDWRYEEMRKYPVPYWLNSLTGMHYFPTYLVYFAFAPAALVLMTTPENQGPVKYCDIIALIGALTAVAIEYYADKQNADFRNTEDYRNGGSVRIGLWQYSRHPNYFGEVLFWVSLIGFAVGAGVFPENEWLVLAGPIAMAIFFRGSSWLMDVRSLERRPGYDVIVSEVSAMVPWFPKRKQ